MILAPPVDKSSKTTCKDLDLASICFYSVWKKDGVYFKFYKNGRMHDFEVMYVFVARLLR